VATLAQGIVNWWVIGTALVAGAAIGIVSAQRVKMTAMPQMVRALQRRRRWRRALVAAGELLKVFRAHGVPTYDVSFTSVLSAVIGAISFAGSIIAFLKLQEVMTGRPITYPGQQFVNAIIALVILACGGSSSPTFRTRWSSSGIALVAAFALGILFVLPIGGRRHAGRHLAAQLVHRRGRRIDRLRAGQQRAHRRPARWSVRRGRCSPC